MRRSTFAFVLAVCLGLPPGAATANTHLESRLPPPDEACSIAIVRENDTPQARRDAARIKRALDRAIAGSADMRKKVKDACSKNGNTVAIFPKRDSPAVKLGRAKPGFFINIDLGDLSALELAMSGKSRDVRKLVDSYLIELLAHEIDHMRGRGHEDPPSNGGKGKPVEDSNLVMKELGLSITRNQYDKKAKNGKHWVEFTVDGQKVLLSVNILEDHLWVRLDQGVHTPQDLLRDELARIPGAPCHRALPPCYPSPPDRDRDGVLDFEDNCLVWVNPRQLDVDGDGLGQGCDADDDGDGWVDAIEIATGASSVEPSSVPEHWATATCANGVDDDADGFVDGEDASCLPPPVHDRRLPEFVPVEAVYPPHLRVDLGGVPEDRDTLPVSLEVELDHDADGAVDEVLTLRGLMVLRRLGDPAGDPAGVTADDDEGLVLEVLALRVQGPSEKLGPVRTRLSPRVSSVGVVSRSGSAVTRDYPARVRFDLHLSFERESGRLDVDGALPLQAVVSRWPFFGETFEIAVGTPPVKLLDGAGNPVAAIAGVRLRVLDLPAPRAGSPALRATVLAASDHLRPVVAPRSPGKR